MKQSIWSIKLLLVELSHCLLLEIKKIKDFAKQFFNNFVENANTLFMKSWSKTVSIKNVFLLAKLIKALTKPVCLNR